MGVERWRASLRTASMKPNPSSLGMLMSVMITSTSAAWASSTARPSSPSTAWTTVKPAPRRAMASMSRMVRESSTVRMVLLKRVILD